MKIPSVSWTEPLSSGAPRLNTGPLTTWQLASAAQSGSLQSASPSSSSSADPREHCGSLPSEAVEDCDSAKQCALAAWRSALPVKQALARAQAGIGEQIPAEQQAFLIQFEPLYVVSVAGVPRQFAERVKRSVLLGQTYLERPNKVPIVAEDVEAFIESEETVILEFAFLRDDPITVDDDEVWFSMTLGAVEVQRSFRQKEMMFGDSLEL